MSHASGANTTTEKTYIKIRLSPTEARRYANRQQRYAVRRACRNWRLGRVTEAQS